MVELEEEEGGGKGSFWELEFPLDLEGRTCAFHLCVGMCMYTRECVCPYVHRCAHECVHSVCDCVCALLK